MNRLFAIVLGLASFACCATADAIAGDWLTREGKGVVRIERKGQQFDGALVWLKDSLDKAGRPLVDSKNPDPALRTRRLQNLPLLREFRFDGKSAWVDGRIYDPKNGKDYSCKMQLDDQGNLEVRGFVGVSLLGRTETWTRKR